MKDKGNQVRGVVFNIQKYSVNDGPGIRTTIFFKGCPLRCWWCHNPEGISPEPEIVVFENRCIGCGECRKVCPQFAFAPSSGADERRSPHLLPKTETGVCTLCGACVKACPSGARQIVGQQMTVAAVMNEVLKDLLFYDDSGGGVTFSGGEPLAQPQFLKELLAHCHTKGIYTAVDTCGFCCQEDLLSIVPLTDLFLYDIKIMDEVKHKQYTGVSNIPILENLKALGTVHNNIWVRLPIIPGLNDDEENLQEIARLATSIRTVRQVNLLPYHKTGIAKFKRLRQHYRLEGISDPSAALLEKIKRNFSAFGLTVKTGG
ncbi:MAG: glycyl-radical enzyme activating protein [Sedimentisphaerales bacterium]|nr:glycyl-radical enzyme activating protein [Sedimentisphaerales bacterium]